MEYDVIIVGAGPSGLSCAIKLAKLATEHQKNLRICVLEKGAYVGAHSISGAVFEPRALNELIPEWKTLSAPLTTPVNKDTFWFLTKSSKIPLPVPPALQNQGNFIISLGELCIWLNDYATSLGVDIFPGFAASHLLFDDNEKVTGIMTNEVGRNKEGKEKPNFQPGIKIFARFTILAEGCRGSLTKVLEEKFQLRAKSDPQTYGIGVKELWEIDPGKHQKGLVIHTLGWPLDRHTYGGSSIYHMDKGKLSLAFFVGLDYQNPYLDPFLEFQRFKHHPAIKTLLEGGRCIGYGARAVNEGGWQAIPKLSFPGGLIIGCAAGFLNVQKLKGNHTAMKSGMLAAEAVFSAINNSQENNSETNLSSYESLLKNSWVGEELKRARNLRPGFRYGLLPGLINAFLETYIFRGKAPWTFHWEKGDNESLRLASHCKPIPYPKPDGVISFDKLTALQFSNTYHEIDQPIHLQLKDPTIPIRYNLPRYAAPEQRYCPALVYEIVHDATANNSYLQINAQNCLHCKTCDIKDPTQNINWVPPEGGGGPNYTGM